MKSLISFCLLIPIFLHAQNNYGAQWVLWNFVTLDFRADTLSVSISAHPKNHGIGTYSNTMCNNLGQILFQTGGCEIYDSNFEIMENGENINSDFVNSNWCGLAGDFPLSQGSTILPYPGDSLKYLIFSYDFEPIYGVGGPLPVPLHLYYHVVDMAQNNGLGKVIAKKQIAVQDTFGRGYLQATRHANGKDWWVIAPKWNSNCYFVTLVNENGPGSYQKQCIGGVYDDNDLGGQTSFSVDGSKFVRIEGHNGLYLFDFDNNTGTLSNPLKLEYPQPEDFRRGISFSPNGRFLYVCARLQLFQFDLWANDIQASLQLVGDLDLTIIQPGQSSLGFCKLAPDGKIYIASLGNHDYLSVINKPNCPGTACDFKQHAIHLAATNYSGISNLPHFAIKNVEYDCSPISATTEPVENRVNISLQPNPASDVVKILIPSDNQGLINIVDQTGISRLTLIKNPAERQFHFDTSALPAGLYFIEFIENSGRHFASKLLVQH